jgi:hypothetical protein
VPGQSRERTQRAGSEGAREFVVRLGGTGHRRVCIAVDERDGGYEEDAVVLRKRGMIRFIRPAVTCE